MINLRNKMPKHLSDLVFNDPDVAKRVKEYADAKRSGNIIFHGPAGTGKSTSAKILVEHLFNAHNCPNHVPIIHAKSINEKSFSSFDNEWQIQKTWGIEEPYVIIEEIDQLSPEHQRKLRAKIDETSFGNFIFTTNRIYGLDDPFVDRCDAIELPPINSDKWKSKVIEWLKEDNIIVSATVVEAMLKTNNGTIRDLKRLAQDIACNFE